MSYPLIMEGNVIQETLTFIHKDLSWLASQLQAKKLRQDDFVYATVDTNGQIYVSGTTAGPSPPIRH